jgi:hypothetical protein
MTNENKDINNELEELLEIVKGHCSDRVNIDLVAGFRIGNGFQVVGESSVSDKDIDTVRGAMVNGGENDLILMVRIRESQDKASAVN